MIKGNIYLNQLFLNHFIRSYWITAENKENPIIKIIELDEIHGRNLITAYNQDFDKISELLDI
jgi:hypothetical protein